MYRFIYFIIAIPLLIFNIFVNGFYKNKMYSFFKLFAYNTPCTDEIISLNFKYIISLFLSNISTYFFQFNIYALDVFDKTIGSQPYLYNVETNKLTIETFIDKDHFRMLLPPNKKWTTDINIDKLLEDMFLRKEFIPNKKLTLLYPALIAFLHYSSFASRNVSGKLDLGLIDKKLSANIASLYGNNNKITKILRLNKQGKLKFSVHNGETYPPLKDMFSNDELDILQYDQKSHFVMAFPRVNTHMFFLYGGTFFLRLHNNIAEKLSIKYPIKTDDELFELARIFTIVSLNLIALNGASLVFNDIFSGKKLFDTTNQRSFLSLNRNGTAGVALESKIAYLFHEFDPGEYDICGKKYIGYIDHVEMFMNHSYDDWTHFMLNNNPGRLTSHNTPAYALPVLKKNILYAREIGMQSYNDYREGVGYKRLKTIDEIQTSTKNISILKQYYNSPDEIDLIVGLYAEDPLIIGESGVIDFVGTLFFTILTTSTGMLLGTLDITQPKTIKELYRLYPSEIDYYGSNLTINDVVSTITNIKLEPSNASTLSREFR